MAEKEKAAKAGAPKGYPFTEAIRGALYARKAADKDWGTSKHLDSRHYPSQDERRAQRKAERTNRKAGRR